MASTIAMLLMNTSCFGDEPKGCEADIETATLHVDHPDQFFFQATDSMKVVFSTDSVITFAVRSDADVSALAPVFTLSAGATVEPASGSIHDFTREPVLYTVTSQDGKWQRRYRVHVVPTTLTVADTLRFDFEHYELETGTGRQCFYIWHNELPDGTLGNDWSTANDGYRISMSTAKPEDYPSTPLLDIICLLRIYFLTL